MIYGGGRSPRTRGSFLSYAFYGRIQFYRVYDKRRSLIYIFTGKNVENIYSRANYNTFLQRAMNICIPLFFNYLLILSLVCGETMELSDSYTDLYSLSVERIHDSVILLASRCPKRFSYHVRLLYPSQGSSLNDSRFPPLSSLLSNKINSSMERKNDVPPLDETANCFSLNKNFRSTIFLFIGHFTFSII